MKKPTKPAQAERSKRGAAGIALQTKGRARLLNPNKRAYDRKRGKGLADFSI